MKLYKKYIFDLDYTLLIPDWSREDEYLRARIPLNEQEAFFQQKQDILNEYELIYPKYDFNTLSDHFKKYGFTVTPDVIAGWMEHNGQTIVDKVADGVIELFEYLRERKVDIVILTSWFGGTQIPRLQRTGLAEYIDYMIAGDDAMKPDLESFELAISDTPKEDCIMIGDSLRSDKAGAENAGIGYYIVDKEHTLRKLLELTKKENGQARRITDKG